MENSRTFQAYSTIFQFSRIFKDMMLFQGLFRASMNHVLGDEHLGKTDTHIWSLPSITSLIWLFIRRISVLNKQLVPVIPKVSVLRLIWIGCTIFAYDYCARLAYIITFDHPHPQNFHLRHPQVSCECRMSNLHDTICCEVMTYASRAQ